MLGLLAGLDRAQFSPLLIVLTGDGPLADLLPGDVPLTDLARPRLRSAAPALVWALRRARPHAVVSTLGYVNLALLASRRFLPRGTRIIVREANMPSLSLPGGPRLMRRLYRRYYPRADAVICTSTMMVEEMARDIGVPRARLHLLPNPIDTSAIRAQAEILSTHDGGPVRFVAAGRLTHQKGFDRLIELFAALPGDSRLTILGDGSGLPALQAACEKFRLGARVSLPGFEANPWLHYARADAFLLPSRWEGMPNAALEALACGTPVIATPESGAIAAIAAAASPGAVTLAPWGERFAVAMAGIEVGAIKQSRPSLLPPGHEPAAVIQRFEKILLSV